MVGAVQLTFSVWLVEFVVMFFQFASTIFPLESSTMYRMSIESPLVTFVRYKNAFVDD